MDVVITQVDLKPSGSPFTGIISKCFEQHLNIYIESQDRSVLQHLNIYIESQDRSVLQHLNIYIESQDRSVLQHLNIYIESQDRFIFDYYMHILYEKNSNQLSL